MPLGCEGDCQISRTEVVRTSGNRMPTGGPGTSSRVLSRMGGELGCPSPILVKARTCISKSTYFPKPVSWTLCVAFPSTVQKWTALSESFSLYTTWSGQEILKKLGGKSETFNTVTLLLCILRSLKTNWTSTGFVNKHKAQTDLVAQNEAVPVRLRNFKPAHQDAAGGGGEGGHVGGSTGGDCKTKTAGRREYYACIVCHIL